MNPEDEKPRLIPAAFRASLDPNDEREYARLAENDEAQTKLRDESDFEIADTPKVRERSKARITIETLLNVRRNANLSPEQRESLAEAFATIGDYAQATETTANSQAAEVYRKIRRALFLADEDWCNHPENHKYIKDYVFDRRDRREKPLLACNSCGIWNVADAPDYLIEAQTRRASVRNQTKGMDKDQVKRFLENSGLKNIR